MKLTRNGRAKLLAKLLEEWQALQTRVVRRQSRIRVRVPLFVAVGAGILLAALLWFPRGPESVLWADVSQKLHSTETLQYRWLQRIANNRSEEVPRWNYATVYQAKHRTRSENWTIPDETSLPSVGTRPDSIGFGFEDIENRTLESYSFDYKGQRFAHSVIYRSVHYPALVNKAEEANASDLLKQLTALPPEAVLKRGRERKHGREVVKFEVIDLAKLKLSTMFGVTSAYIFVDVQSHLPIAIEGVGVGGHISRIWAIEINQSATSIFDLPPLPADVDAEENWTFWLAGRPMGKRRRACDPSFGPRWRVHYQSGRLSLHGAVSWRWIRV